jgi:hypothetical protein
MCVRVIQGWDVTRLGCACAHPNRVWSCRAYVSNLWEQFCNAEQKDEGHWMLAACTTSIHTHTKK